MFPRRLLRSLLALVALAGFFTAGVSEARAVRPCPHHDGVPEAAQGHAQPDHLGHGAPDASDQSDAEHGPCLCIGCYESGAQHQVSTPAAVIVAFLEAPTPFVTSVRDQQLPPVSPAVRWRPDLPNAPPFLA